MTTSDPISLGATGLHLQDLAVSIYKRTGTSGNAVLLASYEGPWVSGGPYTIGDIVYSSAVWYSNLTGVNTSTAPAGDATNWAVFVPPLALVELGDSLYQLTGLTDALPNDRWSVSIALAGSPSSIITTYTYGFVFPGRGPDVISNTPAGYQTKAGQIAIRTGTVYPWPTVDVYGLPSDPTGATGTFALAPLGGGAGITLAGSVAIHTDAYGSPSQYHVRAEYKWAAADTLIGNLPAGVYVGVFTLTVPVIGAVVAPANDQLRVTVSPLVPVS